MLGTQSTSEHNEETPVACAIAAIIEKSRKIRRAAGCKAWLETRGSLRNEGSRVEGAPKLAHVCGNAIRLKSKFRAEHIDSQKRTQETFQERGRG